METFAEYERKLDAPAGFELPAFEGEPLESRVFTSYYFDTEDYSLARSRITLRRRVERGTSTWQLKLPRADDRLEIGVRGRAPLPGSRSCCSRTPGTPRSRPSPSSGRGAAGRSSKRVGSPPR